MPRRLFFNGRRELSIDSVLFNQSVNEARRHRRSHESVEESHGRAASRTACIKPAPRGADRLLDCHEISFDDAVAFLSQARVSVQLLEEPRSQPR